MKTYRINDIFYSLQGEGAMAGKPSVFIRFAGCNLSCSFCDTDTSSFQIYTSNDILLKIRLFSASYVILTGGEPGLQVDTELVDMLHLNGYKVAIETNGTCLLPDGIDWVTVSPKEYSEVVIICADEVKVVYVGQDVERWYKSIRAERYFLQPYILGKEENRETVIAYCLSHPHWSLSLQLHKILNIP